MTSRRSPWGPVSVPQNARHNPMALSSLVHPTPPNPAYDSTARRREQDREPRDSRHIYAHGADHTAYRPSMLKVEDREHYELFSQTRHHSYASSDSSNGDPSPSPSGLSNYHYHEPHRDSNPGYNYSPSSPQPSSAGTSSLIPRFNGLLSNAHDDRNAINVEHGHQNVPRTTSIYHRNQARQDFGEVREGRYFCTYRQYSTKMPCESWGRGYGTWYDLVRHVETEHGPEEVNLIEQGKLDYSSAQWVRSEARFGSIKTMMTGMICSGCGTTFASNRHDSMSRHVSKGVCARMQEKQKFGYASATVHKKKAGKTAADHTRR